MRLATLCTQAADWLIGRGHIAGSGFDSQFYYISYYIIILCIRDDLASKAKEAHELNFNSYLLRQREIFKPHN